MIGGRRGRAPTYCAAAALLATLTVAGAADANRSGIPGRAQIGCGGGGCHSGGDVPTVELIGPASMMPGEVADYALRVGGAQSAAGATIQASGGLLVPGTGLAARAGQLVHAGDTLAYVDGVAEFTFQFEAPDTAGTIELFAAGNAVNDNFQPSGDGWALATTTIVIGSGVAPDAGMSPDAGGEDGDGDGGGDDASGCRQQPGAPAGGTPWMLLLVGAGLLRRRPG